MKGNSKMEKAARELKLLLIEDDPTECKALNDYVSATDGVRIIGFTNNTAKALEYLRDDMPDAIIMNLELHLGGNGIAFMEELRMMNLGVKPFILVTTNNVGSAAYEKARKSGADFIMSKSQNDYSAGGMVDFLLSMKEVIIHNSQLHYEPSDTLSYEDLEHMSKRVVKRIHAELEKVNISPKALGRQYLIDAITITMKIPTKNIYRELSKKYNKSDASIERAMQNAINTAWRTSKPEDLKKYYTAHIGSDKGVPTIAEFRHFYADKIKNEF